MNPFKNNKINLVGFFALALLAMCVAGIASAATVTVTWTNPVTNTDASTIPASGAGSLTSARIEYGTCSAPGVFGVKAGEVTRAMPATSATLSLAPGTTCIRAFVSNTYGVESGASNVSAKVVDPPTPAPPQIVTVAGSVYDVVPNYSTFAFDRGRIVGVTKAGMACDESRKADADYYALERPSYVKLSRQPRSPALVARCG